ncbi:MAG TPA: helix-turn-helix domain-containing protein [Segeticoccus sp.]|uniref:helix-turn-helix transcriptional regulator n=1 Tax=Segeticoccus sp. TaxID=2706531 RepID=UPI002D80651F|nr:helix-turn-helix domain-containing protein [Segeticoccus sp.]HET8601330.1 helix-turn-helix domain-containing protein [Segeticoccus sp.]
MSQEAAREVALPEDRLWTAEEVAYYLSVPVQTVYWWRGAGRGPAGRRVGKRLRYRPSDVRSWVESLSPDVAS